MKKWSTPSFMTYLSKRVVKPKPTVSKVVNKNATAKSATGSTGDAKIDIKRKMMEARKNRPAEKGIKISIGGP